MKFIILVLTAVSLWAGIGNVAALKGFATIHRDGKSINAKPGIEIEQKDTITTKAQTKVQVILNDNTVVTIGSNSSFSFLEFSIKKGDEKISMQSTRGFFRSVTGKIGKVAPERFKVHTVSATIGIRGTDFSGLIKKDLEIIKCYRGVIRVSYEGGSRDIIAGNLIRITPQNSEVQEIMPIQSKQDITPNTTIQEIDPKIEDVADQTVTATHSEEEHHQEGGAVPFTITPNTDDRPTNY